MVIAKAALQAFVEKEVKDYRHIKKWPRKKLLKKIDKKLDKLFPDWDEHVYAPSRKPLKCQLVGAYIALCKEKQFLFFYDPGLGKSKLVLDIIETLFYIRKRRIKALILVDNLTNIFNFAEQVEEHTKLKACILSGSTSERKELLDTETDAQVYIINYAGLIYWLSEKGKGSKKKKRGLNKKAAREFAKNFEFVVFDEVHNCKNKESLTYKVCYELSKHIEYRYGLTGTPTGRNPIDFWAEFKLIDKGETLGKNIGLYRAAFFKEVIHPYFGWRKWTFNRRKYKNLHRLLRNKSLSYYDEEVHDLPPVHEIRIPVPMSPDVRAYYDGAKKILVSAVQGKTSSSGTLVKNSFAVLRQIATGYLKAEDGRIIDLPNPKLEWLCDKLQTIPIKDKIVIFHDFIHSGHRLEKMVKPLKIKYARIWGGTKDKKGELHKFKNDPKCRILIANTKSGAVGLNLQVANRVFFYELPTSVILYRQAVKRCSRTGQTKRVYLYYPYAKDTVEERQLYYLKSGDDILRAVIQGKEEL